MAAVTRSMTAAGAAKPDAEPGENGELGSVVWVGAAFEAAIRARAPGMYASTPMVRRLAAKVGRKLGLDSQTKTLLDVAVRVRDVGMLGLPDDVVLATTPLTPAQWELVNQHPVLGAKLLEELFVAGPAAQVVRSHHERWDGEGYPDGRAGDDIPLLSRVIAVCDAFVAMASDRPHRRGFSAEVALDYVAQERGLQFDPRAVDALVSAVVGKETRQVTVPDSAAGGRSSRRRSSVPTASGGRPDLTSAIAELDLVPAFAPAHERLLAAIGTDGTTGGELVTAIESDTGLTVAVLRRAQSVAGRRPSANVADAVAALSPSEIEEAVTALPRAEFPWRTSELEVLMHRSRLHAQAVARAADGLAREVQLFQRDDLLVAALLHDIGKLVLVRARPDYNDAIDARTTTPEKRIREEQLALGTDHASLGGLLLRRWGLPSKLGTTVATHHTSEADGEVATYVRLADMIAHHSQGEPVERDKMMHLCQVCGLSANALRDVLFDLPRPGGSRRRRADPSPLSGRETEVLRALAQGKVYKDIGAELGLAASTVRSHLHNIYITLAVSDRAQAVLRATEMGWL
jgi:putative nucleotidyltransferase with HDIG domain